MSLADWFHRQRVQHQFNLGRVAYVAAATAADRVITTADPQLPIHVLKDVYAAGLPAVFCRDLSPPYGIVEESVAYPGRHGIAKRFVQEALKSPQAGTLGEAMFLAVNLSHNYYHWIYETLPKVVLAEAAGFRGTYLIPDTGAARQSLDLLGITPDRIKSHDGRLWRVERLYVTAPLEGPMLLQHPAPLALLRDAVLAKLPPPTGRQRLYVSRNRPGVPRRIVNDDALKPLLTGFRFREYFAEDYPLKQQLIDFAGAEAIVGAHGAGFANALFMPPGSLTVELYSPLRNYYTMTLPAMALLRHRHYPLVPFVPGDVPYAHGEDVVAPLDLIETTLKRELG